MTGVFRTSDERVTVVEEKSLYPDEELVADIGNTVTLIKKRWFYFRRFTWILSWFEYFEANLANGHVLHENSALWIKTQTTTNEAWKVQAWKDNQKDYEKGTSNFNLVTIVETNKKCNNLDDPSSIGVNKGTSHLEQGDQPAKVLKAGFWYFADITNPIS